MESNAQPANLGNSSEIKFLKLQKILIVQHHASGPVLQVQPTPSHLRATSKSLSSSAKVSVSISRLESGSPRSLGLLQSYGGLDVAIYDTFQTKVSKNWGSESLLAAHFVAKRLRSGHCTVVAKEYNFRFERSQRFEPCQRVRCERSRGRRVLGVNLEGAILFCILLPMTGRDLGSFLKENLRS